VEDRTILTRIDDLVKEEHAILAHEGEDGPAPEHRERLAELQTTLDQCWDLLRQRRAARESGRDPGSATVRDATTVKRYQQ
jgi:hypothetical protein